jgi:hypothetical protein
VNNPHLLHLIAYDLALLFIAVQLPTISGSQQVGPLEKIQVLVGAVT